MPPRRVRLTLLNASDLSPSVRRLALQAVDGPFEWAAGQYIELGAPDDPTQRLPLSIANAVDKARPGRFELAVVRSSNTEALLAMAAGAALEAEGPKGTFTRSGVNSHPVVLVGTGTGLAPLRAMIQEELADARSVPLLLLFGCRSEQDILWREEFEALALREPRFRFEPTLSAPSEAWAGRRGWVQLHLVELARSLGSVQAYVCGHDAMVRDCVQLLEREVHLAPEQIFVEQY